MNASKIAILLILASAAYAEDGLVIQFTIDESKTDSNSSQRYINSALIKMNEISAFDITDLYNIKFQSSTNDQKNINLVFTLKDLSDGKPYYVGAKSVDISIGESSSFELQKDGSTYKIALDTSYGKLP